MLNWVFLSTLAANTGNGISVCNNFSEDNISIENNTITIAGVFSKGIKISANASSNSLMNINNNIIYDNNLSHYDTGIDTETNYISSLNNNLIFRMSSLMDTANSVSTN